MSGSLPEKVRPGAGELEKMAVYKLDVGNNPNAVIFALVQLRAQTLAREGFEGSNAPAAVMKTLADKPEKAKKIIGMLKDHENAMVAVRAMLGDPEQYWTTPFYKRLTSEAAQRKKSQSSAGKNN